MTSAPGRGSRVLLVLGCLLAFALAFELTARFEDRVRYGMPMMAPWSSEGDLVVRDSLGMHGRPGAQYLKWSMNRLGTRGPEVEEQPSAGTLRVVATGASETFGQSESPGKEYPRQLEDSLRYRMKAAGPRVGPVEVLNAAFFGMTLPTATQDLRLRLASYGAQVVVLYPTSTQYLSDPLPAAMPPVDGPVQAPGALAALRPRAWIRLREEVKRIVPIGWRQRLWQRRIDRERARHGAAWDLSTLPGDRLLAFDQDLRSFVGTVRAIRAEPVLVTHANRFVGMADVPEAELRAWQQFYPRAAGHVILAFDSAGAAITRQVAADSGVILADARAALAGCEICFADHVHFTDHGAARIAGVIADAIAGGGRDR